MHISSFILSVVFNSLSFATFLHVDVGVTKRDVLSKLLITISVNNFDPIWKTIIVV